MRIIRLGAGRESGADDLDKAERFAGRPKADLSPTTHNGGIEAMSTTTTEPGSKPTTTEPSKGNGKVKHAEPSKVNVTEQTASGLLGDYADVAPLVDALARFDDTETAYRKAQDVRVRLADAMANGQRYTPPATWGFGSDNFSAVCAALLGMRTSTGKLRSLARKAGRAILGK